MFRIRQGSNIRTFLKYVIPCFTIMPFASDKPFGAEKNAASLPTGTERFVSGCPKQRINFST